MSLRVCYVVNAVDETSVPATIAGGLVEHTAIEVDILAWFRASQFTGDEKHDVTCLCAPRNTLGMDSSTLRRASDHLGEYDLIQVHHNHSGSLAKLVARRLGTPIVSREGNTRNGFTRLGRATNGVTNLFADRVVCNSIPVYDSFTRWERWLLDDGDVVIIPNGVDLDRIERAARTDWSIREELAIPPNSVLVGTASVLTEQKAIDTLVEGVRLANERTDRVDLVIAGDGPLRAEITKWARAAGIPDRVHVLGMLDRDSVYRVHDQIDVFAMPSRWEGFANAAVEALGAGNACVFSDIDPFQVPFRDVALFHPVDDAAVLAERLVDLAEDEAKREELERRGRALVKREYTLENVAERYYDLYTELVHEAPE